MGSYGWEDHLGAVAAGDCPTEHPKKMIYENGSVAAVKGPMSARQGVTGRNVLYVLGISMFGVIVAFLAIAILMGGRIPL